MSRFDLMKTLDGALGRVGRIVEAFGAVLILSPLLFLPSPAVLAEIPDPGPPPRNCAGEIISQDEYIELMSRLDTLKNTFYDHLFVEEFDYCGEVLRLDISPRVDKVQRVVDGVVKEYWPTVQTDISGQRINAQGVCEDFTLEVVEYWPYSVDDQVTELARRGEEFDPETLAGLQEGNYENGQVYGIMHAPLGDMAVFGHALSIDIEGASPPERWTQLVLVSDVSEDVLANLYYGQNIIRGLADGIFHAYASPESLVVDLTEVSPEPKGSSAGRAPVPGPEALCGIKRSVCYRNASGTYYTNILQSKNSYLGCLTTAAIGAAAAAAVCIFFKGGLGGGWIGVLSCILAAVIALIGADVAICKNQQETRDENHKLTFMNAMTICDRAYNLCMLQIP